MHATVIDLINQSVPDFSQDHDARLIVAPAFAFEIHTPTELVDQLQLANNTVVGLGCLSFNVLVRH